MPDRKYDITVAARTAFIPDQSDVDSGRYVFAYTITITNTGTLPAQLVSRHWIITDGDGRVEEVQGPGVVGEQPVLAPAPLTGGQDLLRQRADGDAHLWNPRRVGVVRGEGPNDLRPPPKLFANPGGTDRPARDGLQHHQTVQDLEEDGD